MNSTFPKMLPFTPAFETNNSWQNESSAFPPPESNGQVVNQGSYAQQKHNPHRLHPSSAYYQPAHIQQQSSSMATVKLTPEQFVVVQHMPLDVSQNTMSSISPHVGQKRPLNAPPELEPVKKQKVEDGQAVVSTATSITPSSNTTNSSPAQIAQQPSSPLAKYFYHFTHKESKTIGLDNEVKKIAIAMIRKKCVRVTGPQSSGKSSLLQKFFTSVNSGVFPGLSGKKIVTLDALRAFINVPDEVEKLETHLPNSIIYLKDFKKCLEPGIYSPAACLKVLLCLRKDPRTFQLLCETVDTKPFPLIDEYFTTISMPTYSEEEVVAILRSKRPISKQYALLDDQSLNLLGSLAYRFSKAAPLAFATDIVDQLFAERWLYKNETSITQEELLAEVSKKLSIPQHLLKQESAQGRTTVEDRLARKVKGQSFAIGAVAKVVRRLAANVNDSSTPAGVMLFVGPTGVGKTELAKALAEELFGTEQKCFTRIDMNEYREQHQVARLWGSPPGYIGYQEGGTLTTALKNNPCSVVLFDEIEKAHPNVLKGLLALFDEGRMTSGKGEVIDAKSTIFVMTSNLGAEIFKAMPEQPDKLLSPDAIEEALKPQLVQLFAPEGYNRIQQTIPFYPIRRQDMEEIVRVQMERFQQEMMKARELEVMVLPTVIKHLAEKYYSPQFGVRPLKRGINEVRNVLADFLVGHSGPRKKVVLFMGDDGKLAVEGVQ